MILNVNQVKHIENYKVQLTFSNGETRIIDLKDTIFQDHRKIFEPLRNLEYFQNFKINLNTITWPNEADFAPEFLLELSDKQSRLATSNSR